MVELDTVVSLSEPIHSKKCSARKKPEANNIKSFFRVNDFSSARWGRINGSISSAVISSRYMPWIDAGAEDHLTKMEENETAMMPITKGIPVGMGAFFFMMFPFP